MNGCLRSSPFALRALFGPTYSAHLLGWLLSVALLRSASILGTSSSETSVLGVVGASCQARQIDTRSSSFSRPQRLKRWVPYATKK